MGGRLSVNKMAALNEFWLGILFIFVTIYSHSVYGLECYVCEEQEGNKDKCAKTTKQCEEHEDICLTNIQWKLPPYWVPYGDRFHSVSKDCSTASICNKKKTEMMPHCKRDWYNDWGCVECCSGDKCNYYATLSANTAGPSSVLLATMGILVFSLTNEISSVPTLSS